MGTHISVVQQNMKNLGVVDNYALVSFSLSKIIVISLF